ncbi:hypothetical protein FSP39_004012, partial [Pinctada imbricata]
VPAHKTVLAIHSEYFRAMFTSGLQESSQSSTTLDEIPSDVLREIVQYMYTGNLQVNKENVQDFIIGCDLLQMENLKSECCNVMDINTDVSNCVWQFADHFHCTSVCNKAVNIIKQQFCYVCQQEEFVSLPSNRLVTILKWKELNLGKEGENTVARCVVCWLEKNLDVKVEDVKEIIMSVRLCHVTDEGIDALMKTHIVEQNPELQRFTAVHRESRFLALTRITSRSGQKRFKSNSLNNAEKRSLNHPDALLRLLWSKRSKASG